MVNFGWLFLAFFVGSGFGIFIGALCNMGKDDFDD